MDYLDKNEFNEDVLDPKLKQAIARHRKKKKQIGMILSWEDGKLVKFKFIYKKRFAWK